MKKLKIERKEILLNLPDFTFGRRTLATNDNMLHIQYCMYIILSQRARQELFNDILKSFTGAT